MIRIFVSLIFFISISINNIAASNHVDLPTGGEINEAIAKLVPVRLLPDNTFYPSVTVKEIFSKFFKPSSVDKADFSFRLTSKRLKETYLLTTEGKHEGASKNLLRYSEAVEETIRLIERAENQKQDVKVLAEKIAYELSFQDTLLRYLVEHKSSVLNVDGAINSFDKMVVKIDSIKPGYKDRYKVNKMQNFNDLLENFEKESTPSPTVEPTIIPDASPRRIIY